MVSKVSTLKNQIEKKSRKLCCYIVYLQICSVDLDR